MHINVQHIVVDYYCDEHVCLFVCAHPYHESHVQNSPNFLRMLSVSVARSFSGGVAICYVLPGFVDDLRFAHNGQAHETREKKVDHATARFWHRGLYFNWLTGNSGTGPRRAESDIDDCPSMIAQLHGDIRAGEESDGQDIGQRQQRDGWVRTCQETRRHRRHRLSLLGTFILLTSSHLIPSHSLIHSFIDLTYQLVA